MATRMNATIRRSAKPGLFQINSDILATLVALNARILIKPVCGSRWAFSPEREKNTSRSSSWVDIGRPSCLTGEHAWGTDASSTDLPEGRVAVLITNDSKITAILEKN